MEGGSGLTSDPKVSLSEPTFWLGFEALDHLAKTEQKIKSDNEHYTFDFSRLMDR